MKRKSRHKLEGERLRRESMGGGFREREGDTFKRGLRSSVTKPKMVGGKNKKRGS